MAVKIRLTRMGTKKKPFYRIIVINASSPREGRAIEYVGHYNPMLNHTNVNRIFIKQDRVDYWINNGAQPTEIVQKLLKRLKSNNCANQSANTA